MKNKKLAVSAVALIVLAAVMLGLWTGMKPEAVEGSKTVTVTVVHKDSSEKEFQYQTDAEYLGEVLLEEGLAEGEAGEYGLMIHTVDGETVSWEKDQSYWALYIGTEYATTGADSIVLTDGGEYGLVYTIG